jgi:hypothetical protein
VTCPARSPEADVSQIAIWANGTHDSATSPTPIRIRNARRLKRFALESDQLFPDRFAGA